MGRLVPKGDQPALARFNQLRVERFTNDISKAIGHSNSRNSRVVQAACFFSLMCSSEPKFGAALVTIEAAHLQMFRSSGGYQAAHYLPGQIWINGGLAWLLVQGPTARQRLEYLFADVEHLPAAFNKADSAAEDKGLCEAFRMVAEMLLHDSQPARKGMTNRALVRRIYNDIWAPGATKAYGDAITQKMAVSEVPPLEHDAEGNISNLKERGEAERNRENEIGILQRYREAMRTAPPDLQEDKILEIERTFRS